MPSQISTISSFGCDVISSEPGFSLIAIGTFTADISTLQPASFLAASAQQLRTHSPSEFAQLPDFAYTLWDWAMGDETCPLDSSIPTQQCHSFTGHMGATNSNHFVPQTSTNYNHYHRLALDRVSPE